MGHGHGHGNHGVVEVGQRARTILIGFLAVVAAFAVAGLIWLWPSGAELDQALNRVVDAPGVTYEDATIDAVTEEILAKVVFNAIPQPLPPLAELAEVTVELPALPAAPLIPNTAVRREGDRGA